jgi:hypothetical protein
VPIARLAAAQASLKHGGGKGEQTEKAEKPQPILATAVAAAGAAVDSVAAAIKG